MWRCFKIPHEQRCISSDKCIGLNLKQKTKEAVNGGLKVTKKRLAVK